MVRYYFYSNAVRDFLIDTEDRYFYLFFNNTNILTNKIKITPQKINGLIKRFEREQYFENAFVHDEFIYDYILTDEQRKRCKHTPCRCGLSKIIIETNNSNDIKNILEKRGKKAC